MTAARKTSGPGEGNPRSSPHDGDLFISGEPAVQSLHAGQARLISLEAASELLTGTALQGTVSTFKTEGPVLTSPCIGPDGTVYAGSSDNKLYAIKEGKKVWAFEAKGPLYSSPCIGPDGTVYIGSNDNKLHAIKEGKEIWDFHTEGYVHSSPCIGPDGTIYVGGSDKKLYAIKCQGKRFLPDEIKITCHGTDSQPKNITPSTSTIYLTARPILVPLPHRRTAENHPEPLKMPLRYCGALCAHTNACAKPRCDKLFSDCAI